MTSGCLPLSTLFDDAIEEIEFGARGDGRADGKRCFAKDRNPIEPRKDTRPVWSEKQHVGIKSPLPKPRRTYRRCHVLALHPNDSRWEGRHEAQPLVISQRWLGMFVLGNIRIRILGGSSQRPTRARD